MVKLNIPLPDNSVGVEPDLREMLGEGANPLEELWLCPMQTESDILRQATFANGGLKLDLMTASNLTRVRMRLYRAKKLLQDKGNRYVKTLTMTIESKGVLWIRHAEDLTKYIIKEE